MDNELTERELRIIELIAGGQTTKQIAATMHLSPATVKEHRSFIFIKLDACSAAHAVSIAFRLGYLK